MDNSLPFLLLIIDIKTIRIKYLYNSNFEKSIILMCLNAGALQDFDNINIGFNSKRRSSPSTSQNATQSVATAENSEQQRNDDSKEKSDLTESSIQDTERFFM